jgi:ubiquinone/menaquinone biosynthesis C-methylase UbiE
MSNADARYYHTPPQLVKLPDISASGWILDLGGGGEGVIGQVFGSRVIAIDRSRRELEEAPGGALKIVMDAKEMQFMDNTFDTVTAYFFLLFTLPENRARIFPEVYRVMRPGGRWLIWDVTIPPFPGGSEDIYTIRVTATLPDGRTIEAGYGAPWPGWQQSAADYAHLAREAGFVVTENAENELLFHLELQKPN